MGGVISVVIIFWVIIIVVKKGMLNQAGGSKNTNAPAGSGSAKKYPAPKKRAQGFTNYKPHKDIVSVSRDMGDAKNSSVLRDDRTNDWLARQLREEHRAFKATSEMFDLKIEHASHCDSKLIEQFHHRYCDADGIDIANGTTVHRR